MLSTQSFQNFPKSITFVIVSLFFLLLSSSCNKIASSNDSIEPAKHRVLLDSIHAHNFLDRGLDANNRNYHSLFGLKDGVDFLRQNNTLVEEVTKGTLTSRQLNNYDTLLINLVSDNLPSFLVKEIAAIKAFIESGGNLLVLTDHSNAYHHT